MRYTAITPEGLFSYKSVNEPFSYSIKAGTVKYIWTRFDFLENMLVIKLMHGNH